MHKLLATATTALLGLALAACSNGQPNSTTTVTSSSPIDNAINHILDHADTQLKTEDLTLDNKNHIAPEGKITPQGDLLIAGNPVPLTPAQRREVLAYRQQAIGVGEQGIAVGRQGAAIGLQAAGTAIAAALSGQSSTNIEQKMKGQATGMEQAAAKLCARLPALMAAQQQLAAAVPAFKPYARMTHKDIENCHVHVANPGDN